MQRGSRLPRAVVDTNLFVSASITKRGTPAELLTHWKDGHFTLLMSEEQRSEVSDVLRRSEIMGRYGLLEHEIASLLLLTDTLGVRAPLRRRLPLRVRDPKDEHLLAAALGGRADYLVTGDDDLLELDGNPKLRGLRIVTARALLDLLASQQE